MLKIFEMLFQNEIYMTFVNSNTLFFDILYMKTQIVKPLDAYGHIY